jgi:hypothetical protein
LYNIQIMIFYQILINKNNFGTSVLNNSSSCTVACWWMAVDSWAMPHATVLTNSILEDASSRFHRDSVYLKCQKLVFTQCKNSQIHLLYFNVTWYWWYTRKVSRSELVNGINTKTLLKSDALVEGWELKNKWQSRNCGFSDNRAKTKP